MPSQWVAVEAETDPLVRARELQRSWERLLAEGTLGLEPPPGAVDSRRGSGTQTARLPLNGL